MLYSLVPLAKLESALEILTTDADEDASCSHGRRCPSTSPNFLKVSDDDIMLLERGYYDCGAAAAAAAAAAAYTAQIRQD